MMRCLRERKLFTFPFNRSFIFLVESLVGALKSCLLNASCFRIWNWLPVIFSNTLWFDKIIHWAEYEQEIESKVAHIIYQCKLDAWNAISVSMPIACSDFNCQVCAANTDHMYTQYTYSCGQDAFNVSMSDSARCTT